MTGLKEPTTQQGIGLRVLSGRFAVCRLGAGDQVPAEVQESSPVSITRTSEEVSVVCGEELAPAAARCEKGWRCLGVKGPLPFSATGVLAALAVPLAEASVPIFVISTFDTDYIFVRDVHMERAVAALRAAGHDVEA